MNRRTRHLALGALVAVAVISAARPQYTSTAHGAAAAAIKLAAPTGPVAVGTRSLMLVDNARKDPFDPRHAHRRLMLRLWYPTRERGRRAAYLPASVARVYSRSYGLPPTTFARVTTNSVAAARPAGAAGSHPLILFSPGYSVPSALYTTLFEELASRGFVVLALDHTYETEAVEFPTGAVVRRTLPDNPIAKANPASYRLMLKIINTRIADAAFVLHKLRWLNSHVADGTIDIGRVGVFGHSLGGLTAAAIAAARPGVRAAADLDGSIYGPGTRAVTRRPFMIMTEHGDGTMARYWAKLRSPRLFVRIDGTRHLNFSDWTVLAPLLPGARPRPPVGSIAPQRALTIIRTYLVAFFKRYAADEAAPLLDQPVPYPEVKIKR